jgi:hypothetical protein
MRLEAWFQPVDPETPLGASCSKRFSNFWRDGASCRAPGSA